MRQAVAGRRILGGAATMTATNGYVIVATPDIPVQSHLAAARDIRSTGRDTTSTKGRGFCLTCTARPTTHDPRIWE